MRFVNLLAWPKQKGKYLMAKILNQPVLYSFETVSSKRLSKIQGDGSKRLTELGHKEISLGKDPAKFYPPVVGIWPPFPYY